MSKKNKLSKKDKKRRKNAKMNSAIITPKPATFFRGIGIRSPRDINDEPNAENLHKAIESQLGKDTAEAFRNDCALNGGYSFCHSTLELAKLWSRNEFGRLRSAAEKLAELPIPSRSRILDIGGGAGQLAFWMRKIWNDCHVTVVDAYSDIGMEWAEKIGENSVTFLHGKLPELEGIKSNHFNVVVLSRVLGNMSELGLPSSMESPDRETYFTTQEAKRLSNELGKIADSIKRVMTETGRVIILESWSDDRIFILGRIFEEHGLFINMDLFPVEKVGIKPSIVVFSKVKAHSMVHDVPLALASSMTFPPRKQCNFRNTSAESIRKLFQNATTIAILEYIHNDETDNTILKLLEKDGVVLFHLMKFTGGVLQSTILPATEIPHFLQKFKNIRNEIRDGKGRIVKSYGLDLFSRT